MEEGFATQYPHLSGYVAGLPTGLESYPDFQAKCSLLRGVLDKCPAFERIDGMPSALRDVLLNPPAPSAWIPEVYYVAAHFAVVDACGVSPSEVIEITYRANKALTESRMYRALAKVASPSTLMRGAVMSWGLIHKGVQLSLKTRPMGARLRLSHPHNLYPKLAHDSAALGFRAVIEAAGGEDVVSEVTSSWPRGAEFEARWQ
jgi:hypothetical protein